MSISLKLITVCCCGLDSGNCVFIKSSVVILSEIQIDDDIQADRQSTSIYRSICVCIYVWRPEFDI